MNPYKSILLTCKLKLNEDKSACILDLPFKTYSQNIVMNGKDITYRLDKSLAGSEVLAKTSISQYPMPHANDTDDRALAEALPGYIGNDWAVVQKDVRYTKHYSVTKADALATYTELGVKIPYAGVDKDEVVKFTQWESTKEISHA